MILHVILEDDQTRVARVKDEVVMTSRGYAQPATVSLHGKKVKGFVQTADACKRKGFPPFFTEQKRLDLGPVDPNPDGDDLNLPPAY